MPLEADTRALLLRAARGSIRGAFPGEAPATAADSPDPVLAELRATFVTLKHHEELRGCIGTLEAHRPLLQDVMHNSRAAAFHDPRFPPVRRDELAGIAIEISVLSLPAPLPVRSREELLRRLEPGRHGLVLQEGARRATFLPAVWESLHEPELFLGELLRKAGLERAHWSDRLRFFTYTTESFAERDG